ncbi:MAG: hypothetical protein ACSHWZ_03645 [Sulfitobacter sp.]
MKILVLGDSHAAAVKHGWTEIADDHPDIALDFFALPLRNLSVLRANGSQLRLAKGARARHGDRFRETFPSGAIELKNYDAVLLTGFIDNANTLMKGNYRTYLPWQITYRKTGWLRRGAPEPVLPKGKTIGTKALFEAAWDDVFAKSLAATLPQMVCDAGAKRCFLAINPLLSADVLKRGNPMTAPYRHMLRLGDADFFLTMARTRLLNRLPDAVTLIDQPAQTIHQTCLTKTDYMQGAAPFHADGSLSKADVLHGNARYGAALLEDLFRRAALDGTAPEGTALEGTAP